MKKVLCAALMFGVLSAASAEIPDNAIGGVIGKQMGNTAAGAIVGAAIGGTAGAAIGNYMDSRPKRCAMT